VGDGPEDHIQVDLADPANTDAAIAEIKNRWMTASCMRWSTTPRSHEGRGRQTPKLDRNAGRDVGARLSGQFLRADPARARPA